MLRRGNGKFRMPYDKQKWKEQFDNIELYVLCECGKTILGSGIDRHKKCKWHINNMPSK